MNFDNWIAAVDTYVTGSLGIGIHDIADRPYYDWFEDELTPREAADIVIEDAFADL
jgi:hypothetical protein